MASRTFYGRSSKLFFSKRHTTVAVHTSLHAKRFTAIGIFRITLPMAISTIHLRSMMHTMMKYNMFRKHRLFRPWIFRRYRKCRIKRFNPRIFSQRQTMAIHAIHLAWKERMFFSLGTRMAVHAVKPYRIPMKDMLKRNVHCIFRTQRAIANRNVHLAKQKVSQQKSTKHREECNANPFHAKHLLWSTRIFRIFKNIKQPGGHHFSLNFRQRCNVHRRPFFWMLGCRMHKILNHPLWIIGIMRYIIVHRRSGKLASPSMTPLTFVLKIFRCI